MRKKTLLAISCCCFIIGIGKAQTNLGYVAGKYFRSNPYKTDYNVFLTHLINDPDIKNKEQIKKTDSTLYSFSGTYAIYQPFKFKAEKVLISLKEKSFLLDETLSDTMVNYMISAFLPNTADNQKIIKKEAARVYKKNKRLFHSSNRQDIVNDKKVITGSRYNMFVLMNAMAPMSIIWKVEEATNKIALHLLFRISYNNNRSDTPLPLLLPYNTGFPD